MAQAPIRISYNVWAEKLYRLYPTPDCDYYIVSGGRGSSKTFEITQALIFHGHTRPLRICVAREHLKSIDESAKPELEDRARRLGVLRSDCYTPQRTAINHANGTHIFFIGLSKLSEEDIKGLAMVDILWIEEAHRMSHSSWELIRPTIRKDGAIILASFNPKFRNDAIWQFRERNKHDSGVWIVHVTYRDNAYFTNKNERDRLRDKDNNPERYDHIWEGKPDDASEKRKVLPYQMLQNCVDLWDQRPQPRGAHSSAGLDVADTGTDKNSFAMRSGPELYFLEHWRMGTMMRRFRLDDWTTADTARYAIEIAEKNGVTSFQYDAGGPGAGIRDPLRQKPRPFIYRGCQFGGKVQAPDVSFIAGRSRKTQEEYFKNWASQAGWAMRLRAEGTARLKAGETIDPYRCLFINPEIPDLQDVLAEMSQPEWEDPTGKLKIEKQPHEPNEAKPPSPDDYDAALLAFSTDARKGLRRPY